MASKRSGEAYWGEELHVPLSSDGQVSAYVWPLRILSIRGESCGGPTIGVDVGNEEVLRFDCHASQGHWHTGGYDRLGAPGNSHVDFPEGLTGVKDQVAWSLRQLRGNVAELLAQSEQGEAARKVESYLVESGLITLRDHIEKNNYLRDRAIAEQVISG
ncbi:MAG: hypothetical protein F4X65_09390 [Chloroflexi bacterium]|nr:hypothetical protein [Chloroflexota bacterium]